MAQDKYTCTPNPDVAGLGIIYAVLTAAALTIIISYACLLLRWSSVARETRRFLHTLPNRGDDPFADLWPLMRHDDHPFWTSTRDSRRRLGLWHRVLDKVLLGIGLNQLLAGFALLVCSIATYGFFSTDPHALMALGLSTISSFSQLPVPFVMQNPNPKSTAFRIAVLVAFQLLIVTTDVALLVRAGSGQTSAATERSDGLLEPLTILVVMIDIVTFFILLAPLIGQRVNKLSVLRKPVVSLSTSLLVSLSNTFGGVSSVFNVKYMNTGSSGCNLNSAAEDQWTLGQILALVMLLGLILPAVDVYFEERELEQTKERSELERLHPSDSDDQVVLHFEPDGERTNTSPAAGVSSTADLMPQDRPIRRTTSGLESQRT